MKRDASVRSILAAMGVLVGTGGVLSGCPFGIGNPAVAPMDSGPDDALGDAGDGAPADGAEDTADAAANAPDVGDVHEGGI